MEHEYTNSQIKAAIDDFLHSRRDRAIMVARLIDGLTMEQIAELAELSPRQVRTIVHRCEAILFKHCP